MGVGTQLILDGITFPLKQQMDRLEVFMDASLKGQVGFFQLRLIYQLQPYFQYINLFTIMYAFAMSWLDFYNAFHVAVLLKTIWKLKLVQS